MAYFKTTIKAGRTLEIHKGYVKRTGKKISEGDKKKLTPEEIEKINEKNAENKLRRKINANFGCGDFHLILTYRKEERPDKEKAKELIREFLKKMRKEYKAREAPLKYIQVTEYEKKAIHHHLIINDIENENVIKIVRKLWKYGNPKMTTLDDTGQYKKLAQYLIKETAKTFRENRNEKKGQMQRWSCSRNLIEPEAEIKVVQAAKWKKEPKVPKGYYLDEETLVNGICPFTGTEYQKYTLVKIVDG